ncbi:TPA: radical SAM protein [Methanosarcinaceae archaeon]|nr:radical SAM protein [Methanosarcinaceae archaeon]
MEKFTEDETGSFYNYLPEGCQFCQQGAKLVLFVTGLCPKSCFYCPLSDERRGKDLVFANERPVINDADLLEEAKLMDALGAGITGGEPLLKIDRVLHYISLLKSSFGKEHHIHLYTAMAPDRETLEKLAKAGLDEIRFHPPQEIWDKLEQSPYSKAVQNAKDLEILAGIEIPALEGAEKVAVFAEKKGIFLNLNELEFSENNSEALLGRGFVLESDTSNAVAGSLEHAKAALSTCKKAHFCSSNYKDAVQLRKRLQRIAKNTAREFDEVTEDGTLMYGVIEGEDRMAREIMEQLLYELKVPKELFGTKENSIEIAWWVLEELNEDLKEKLEACKARARLFVIERYPLEDGMVVELIPL